mmetsp:Transcript_6466/g.13749  ORF Transcript_6466/g.13749 Transcript_6466/m.13749 type:complete len:215 (+) Transcript_6466:767-1411(+)
MLQQHGLIRRRGRIFYRLFGASQVGLQAFDIGVQGGLELNRLFNRDFFHLWIVFVQLGKLKLQFHNPALQSVGVRSHDGPLLTKLFKPLLCDGIEELCVARSAFGFHGVNEWSCAFVVNRSEIFAPCRCLRFLLTGLQPFFLQDGQDQLSSLFLLLHLASYHFCMLVIFKRRLEIRLHLSELILLFLNLIQLSSYSEFLDFGPQLFNPAVQLHR